jgi:hypothetical protein
VPRPSLFGGTVLAVACSGIVATAACGLVTGLAGLKEGPCAGVCDGGGNSKQGEDAAQDGISPDGAADAAESPESGNDAAPSEASEAGDVADTSPGELDVTPPLDAGVPETSDAESKDAIGPADAARETAGTCQSNVLVPTGATASSLEGDAGLFPANNAIDGNLTTRWASAQGVDPQSIVIDYGAPVFVDRVQILWETACATNFTLDISNDMASWSSFKTVTGNMQGGPSTTDWTTAADYVGLTAVGRYLRVNGTMRCTIYGYSIWEMRAFGDRDAKCHP